MMDVCIVLLLLHYLFCVIFRTIRRGGTKNNSLYMYIVIQGHMGAYLPKANQMFSSTVTSYMKNEKSSQRFKRLANHVELVK